jgi:hypothetical protein
MHTWKCHGHSICIYLVGNDEIIYTYMAGNIPPNTVHVAGKIADKYAQQEVIMANKHVRECKLLCTPLLYIQYNGGSKLRKI